MEGSGQKSGWLTEGLLLGQLHPPFSMPIALRKVKVKLE